MKQQTVGIVGGGQLGRMLTLAALPLGFKVVVVDPSPDCPAAQVGADEITANLYDETALHELADRADFITVEIEHLDTNVLEALEKAGTTINPSPSTIRLIQDKLKQKEFLAKANIPLPEFRDITDEASAKNILSDFGGSMIVKTRHGAYDGRGNFVVHAQEDLTKALEQFAGQALYAEKLVDFDKELAAMVARDQKGNVKLYPIVETIQTRNICTDVLAPAPISAEAQQKAETTVRAVAELLDGAGTFGIELFLTHDGEVVVNEIAPRVHNSGHYTTEACRTSQFEQHIRAITGLPLGETNLMTPAAVMINILGERDGPTELTGLAEAMAIPGISVHMYGKSPTKIDRKMGHITATAATLEEARANAQKARKLIRI